MDKICELSTINGVKIFLPTYFIYQKSMKDNMNDCEILIRFLALDEYFAKNNYGFKIYDEIQKYRVNLIREIPSAQYDNVHTFKNLINSIQTKGFLSQYPIVLNKDFSVVDGAHRLAIALYLGIKEVPVVFPQEAFNFEFDYSINWLKSNGFEKYLDLLYEQHERIVKMYEDNDV